MHTRKWFTRWLILGVLVLLALPSTVFASQGNFPDTIPLPDGFQPEGIVVGRGSDFYVGSIPTGAIFKGDLRTGEGDILVPGEEGRAAIGLGYDERSDFLFVSGGPTGKAFVYDASRGELQQEYVLTAETNTFVNDVVVTREAAYFTDSFQPFIYRIPLGPGGRLPDAGDVQAIELSGDYTHTEGFNTNGIEATPNGKELILVHSSLGVLYRVDPETGEAVEIPLEGGDVLNGDGILLLGKKLYVVQNQLNQIAVIRLDARLESGEIKDVITDPDFRIPTTIDNFGKNLYVVNARFDTEPAPDTEYEVVQVPRSR